MDDIPLDVWTLPAQWKPVIELILNESSSAAGTHGSSSSFNFTMSNMVHYFLHRKAVDGLPNHDHRNLNSRAFPLFKAGHIQDVAYMRYSETCLLIKAKCYAEMKKKELYSIRCVFDSNNDIKCMTCGCVAGIGPTCTCKHVGALCYFLEELCRLRLSSSQESCTSKLQTWHQLHKRPFSTASTLDTIKFVKVEHGKNKKIVVSSNYDPRPIQFRRTKQSEINQLRESILELPTPVAFEQVLPLQTGMTVADTSTPVWQTQPLPLVPRSVQIRLQAELKYQHQPISLDSLYVSSLQSFH